MSWGRLGRTLPAAAGLVLLLGTACSAPVTERKTDGTLDLLTWWSVPGEQNALAGLLETYSERHPQTRVNSSAATSRIAAENQLESLFVNDAPPDSFLTAGGEHLKRHVVAELGDGLESVDAIAERADFTRHLPNVVRAALTHDGKLYGIPLDIPRLNVLLYNADVFAGSQLEPPTTLEEFYTVCEALRARNVVPFAIGTRDGSVLSQMLFDALLATPELLDFRDAFLSGDADPNDARIITAVTELGRILGYTNTDRDTLDWNGAARQVIDGEAAMTFTGDWAKAFMQRAGLRNLGVVEFPGTQGAFIFLANAFTLPAGAAHRQAGVNFLNLVASKEGATAFVGAKGTTAARLDFNGYDALARETALQFRASQAALGHIARIRSRDFILELDATMRRFSENGQIMPVLNMLQNRYGQL